MMDESGWFGQEPESAAQNLERLQLLKAIAVKIRNNKDLRRALRSVKPGPPRSELYSMLTPHLSFEPKPFWLLNN